MLAPRDQIAEGRQAWARLQERQRTSWGDWRTVAEALAIGKEAALLAAGTRRPYGRRYVSVYGAWLVQNGFDSVTSACRYRLGLCIDNIDQIERWRASLDDQARARLAHPDSIWFAWKRSLNLPTRTFSKPNRPGTLKTRTPGRPSQDFVRRIAGAIREGWTTDTFKLATIVIAAVASDPDLDSLFTKKPAPRAARAARPPEPPDAGFSRAMPRG